MSWLLGHTDSDEDAEIPSGFEAEQAETKPKEESSGFTSFWGALNTIKTKSLSAIETTKKDFSEFGSAFSSETKDIREEVSEVFKPKPAADEKEVPEKEAPEREVKNDATAKQSSGPSVLARAEEQLTDNLEKLSQGVENLAEKVWGGAVTLLPSIFGMSGPEVVESGDKVSKITKEQELKALQGNSLTYTSAIEPENSEAFENLTQDFSERYDEFWGPEVTKMLANSLIRGHYDQLVPEIMSEDAFWCHYVFRKRALDLKHERKQQLESRLAQTKDDNSFGDLGWDDDETPSGKSETKVAIDVNPPETPPTTPPTPATPTHAVVLQKQEARGEGDGEESNAAASNSSSVSDETEESSVSLQQSNVANTSSTTTAPAVSVSTIASTVVPAPSSSSPSLSSAVLVTPPESEPIVVHMHREISGSPESSDWESTKLVPSQSDSEPWEAGVEDAVLKAMCEAPDASLGDLDVNIEGLVLGEEVGESAGKQGGDDWDQWE